MFKILILSIILINLTRQVNSCTQIPRLPRTNVNIPIGALALSHLLKLVALTLQDYQYLWLLHVCSLDLHA
jgi:hypothetical protein